MPAAITHMLFGEQVLERLNGSAVADLINRSLPAYRWGCIGPDFLIFHRMMPWQTKIGLKSFSDRIHASKVNATFQSMLDYIGDKGSDFETLLAYFYGFVTHYAIDRSGHPFVFSIQKCIENDKGFAMQARHIHTRVEAMLDTIMLRSVKGELPSNYKLHKLLEADSRLLWEIAGMYEYVISHAFDERYPAGVFEESLRDTRKAMRFIHDPIGLKRPVVRFFERLLNTMPSLSASIPPDFEDMSYDYANGSNAEWENVFVPGEMHCESFLDIFDAAVDDAVTMISGFCAGFGKDVRASHITGGRSFESNLAVDTEE